MGKNLGEALGHSGTELKKTVVCWGQQSIPPGMLRPSYTRSS